VAVVRRGDDLVTALGAQQAGAAVG